MGSFDWEDGDLIASPLDSGIARADRYIWEEWHKAPEHEIAALEQALSRHDAQQTIKSPVGVSLTAEHTESARRRISASQMHAEKGIRVLETAFSVDTPGFRLHSPAYLLAVARHPTGGSYRIRVLGLARDGHYKPIWQRRSNFGAFHAVDVYPANPLYDRLYEEADVAGIAKAMVERGEI